MSNNDQSGEGTNYFSVFKIGGVKENSFGPNAQGPQNPGTKVVNVGGFDPNTGLPNQKLVLDNSYTDGSDALANQGFTVSFQSALTSKTTVFKAFITSFNESYNSNWNAEEVYGRTDPIYMFRNTTRSITLGLLLPAATEGEAQENLIKLQHLIKMLYPAYSEVQGAQTIAQSPLIRLKMINMTNQYKSMVGLEGNISGTETFMQSTVSTGPGLLGLITNLSINHNIDNPAVGVFEVANGVILPKLIEIQLDFKAIHESTVRQAIATETSHKRVPHDADTFPYGITNPTFNTQAQIDKEYSSIVASYNEQVQAEREAERGQEMADQAQANAEARYSGLLGGMRFRRDQRRLQGKGLLGDFKNAEKRRYIQEAVAGEMASRSENVTYESAVEGLRAEGAYRPAVYDTATGEIID